MMDVEDISAARLTIGDVIKHLTADAIDVPPPWPPDAFAVAAYLLKHSGAYIDIINVWPPEQYKTPAEWESDAKRIADGWRSSWITSKTCPGEIATWWQVIAGSSGTKVMDILGDRVVVEALVGIVATADQACFGVGIYHGVSRLLDAFDNRWLYLLNKKSLCSRIDPSVAMVLPKLHNPLNGMTLRSLTHNLALWDRPEVAPIWKQLARPDIKCGINMLLLPWPLSIDPKSFHDADPRGACREKMPPNCGLFTYEIPSEPIDADAVRMLVKLASDLVGNIDAVVFPELSMSVEDFLNVRGTLNETLIIAGVGESEVDGGPLGSNSVMIGLETDEGLHEHSQYKHHRWRLDAQQMQQYGIGYALDTRKVSWWEAIDMPPRSCAFFSVNPWLTFCVLICEDLARQDPVAELVRAVGPNLVIALLMDGAQLPDRWSARYATVLADDPRCSVLTLTSAGLVDMSRSQGLPGPRSIGLWKDAVSGGKPTEIHLAPKAKAVVLSLSREWAEEWAADGRSDGGYTGYLRLRGTHQVYLPEKAEKHEASPT